MAEWLMKKAIAGREKDFQIRSAGISAMDGFSASEETISALKDEGVDASMHQSRLLTREMIKEADEIYAMERMHKEWILHMDPTAMPKVHLITEYAQNAHESLKEAGIPDPIRMSTEFYRNVMSVIKDCVRNIARRF
jgi:protein-tyrosine phosphatase